MYVCGIAVCTYAERDCRKEVCTHVERDCRKEVHTESVVALSNSEGQTAGGTRERAGRVGATTNAENFSVFFFLFPLGATWGGRRRRSDSLRAGDTVLGSGIRVVVIVGA